MRILFCNRPGGAFGYITDGLINALRDKGHQTQRWDGNPNSWDAFDPDLYYGASGHRQPIPTKRRAKVAIHVNPYGPVSISGINEGSDGIQWVLTQKPDVVFGYGTHEDRIIWSHWQSRHGIPWVPMPTAADAIIFKQVTDLQQRTHDVVYLGGRWQYKAITIDMFLLPLLESGRVSYKLYGWGDWPNDVCSGPLAADQVNSFLNSGKVGPCLSEKHTHQFGIDVPERAFKLALCGVLVVHDPVPTVRSLIPSAVVAKDTHDFLEKCVKYCKPEFESERLELVNKQRDEVLNSHTYHHRMKTLLDATGFTKEAEGMIN